MRLIAHFARETSDHIEIITRFDTRTERRRLDKAHPQTDSIATEHHSAVWFERKMHDDYGIRFDKSFDTRPLLHHERFPQGLAAMRKSFTQTAIAPAPYRPYKYETIGGDGVFEVSVGPIHAGIIEPGHFHFSQAGEAMLHQEVRHFYKYRGIEKMLEGKSPREAKPIIERISGNESIAYQIAWAQILSDAMQTPIPEPMRAWHAILLETERIIHHLTDLGFIPNDAGFAAALAYASRLAEETRRTLAQMSGHRFGFGAVTLDGTAPRIDLGFFTRLKEELERFDQWIGDIPSLWDRFDTTGRLTAENARRYACVGVVAKACGIAVDVRSEDPFYRAHGFETALESSGDVAARFRLRIQEVGQSIALIERFARLLEPVAAISAPIADGEYMTRTESSIGELFCYMEIREGVIARFFARDPSFINWQALHLMMPGNIIPDFPLINKSCDLSYAGNDL